MRPLARGLTADVSRQEAVDLGQSAEECGTSRLGHVLAGSLCPWLSLYVLAKPTWKPLTILCIVGMVLCGPLVVKSMRDFPAGW